MSRETAEYLYLRFGDIHSIMKSCFLCRLYCSKSIESSYEMAYEMALEHGGLQ